jgi:protein involved in polysaccharide export with SLBB domain
MTPQCLQARVVQEYAQYLAHPADIDVTVAYRIGVTGAVHTPGVYNVDATMSVADVVALAGGVDGDGNSKKILLLHDGGAAPIPLTAATTAVSTIVRSGDRIYVEQKSWLARNVAPTVTAASAAMYLLVAALR